MGKILFYLAFLGLLCGYSSAASRSCSNVVMTFPLTSNTTSADEFLSADTSATRRVCTVPHINNIGVSSSVDCTDVPHHRRMRLNWPLGGSRDFYFSRTDELRGLVYVTDRSHGIIYACTTTPTATVALPCIVVTKGRTQPKGVELMPPDLDGMAWIETAGRGIFVMGSTIEIEGEAAPQQILLGEYVSISFDMKQAYNQDGTAKLTLYALAKNNTLFAIRLIRTGTKVTVIGDIVDMGKIRSPNKNAFFARPLRSVVSLTVYDTVVYFATSSALYRTMLSPRTGDNIDVYQLSSSTPTQLHSLTFDGPRRRNRPRISRLTQTCQVPMDASGLVCGVRSAAKTACEKNGGICLGKRLANGTTVAKCLCPSDYSMDATSGMCVRWRTPYFQLSTHSGIQRYEIAKYTQDSYGAFPTIDMKVNSKPKIADDDAFLSLPEMNNFNEAMFGASTSDAFIYKQFSKKMQRFNAAGDEFVLLRNEPAAKFLQYEPRSKMMYWLDDARHMVLAKDAYSTNNLTRTIFWHRDLLGFYIDSEYRAMVFLLVSPAFAYQNHGFVRHSSLSFIRCNLAGYGCSRCSADVPFDERNSSIISAYDPITHRLYVVRDREFPSRRLTLTVVDVKNWRKFPDTVRLSVTRGLMAMTSPDGPTPLFSVFDDRIYIIVSPKPSTGSSKKKYISMFAGSIYRRTHSRSSRIQPDIQGPVSLPIESTPSNQVIEFNVGYIYKGIPSQLGSGPLNCSKRACKSGELCINDRCYCAQASADKKACSRPIRLSNGVANAQGNYTWKMPPAGTDCHYRDTDCLTALRFMCDGIKGNLPKLATRFDDEDPRACILAGFDVEQLKKSETFYISPHCEVSQSDLCDNTTSPTCTDVTDESSALCTALRKLPGICANTQPIRQCFLTPDSMSPSTRSWFFQGRTGGAPPNLITDAPQCVPDTARKANFRCVCASWAMMSDDRTRCIPNNPCLDTETNTDHCAPNGKCRYSEYARRDFVCDCNPGFVYPPGRADICISAMDLSKYNRSNICYQRRELCGQRYNRGSCVPGLFNDPSSFTCKCNSGYKLSRNGMDCVRDRISRPLNAKSRYPSHPCFTDNTLCSQDREAGRCVVLSRTRFYCLCKKGYRATADGRDCVPTVSADSRTYNDIKRVFYEQDNGTFISKSAFVVAFRDAFQPKVVFTEDTNRALADSSLSATPLLVVNQRDVFECTSTVDNRTIVKNSENIIEGVASNRILGIGYLLTSKTTEIQLEVGAFALPANNSRRTAKLEFFRVPFAGNPESPSAAKSFVLDGMVGPNMLIYTTKGGKSLVMCSSYLSPPLNHLIPSAKKTNQPPLFGGMDCIKLIREFSPVFTSVAVASRQRNLVWTDMPPDNEFGRNNIPSVNEISIPEAFALEYSKQNVDIFDRNIVKRKLATREFWLGKNAGSPGRHVITAYDSIENRLTWVFGFENIPVNTDELKNKKLFGVVFMSFDYNSNKMGEKVFAEFVAPLNTPATIYSERAKLSVSNKVAALTLPDIQQLWMFEVPTADTRIFPVINKVPKIVSAAFPAATPETYERTACDDCFGVCLEGARQTVCVCPEENHHSSCTPLSTARNNYDVLPRHEGRSNSIAVIIVIIIVVLLLVGVVGAALVFVVRACGGVSQTVDRMRSRVHRQRLDDSRPLTSDAPEKKRGFHLPSVFNQNQPGYVAFDRNNENVSMANDEKDDSDSDSNN